MPYVCRTCLYIAIIHNLQSLQITRTFTVFFVAELQKSVYRVKNCSFVKTNKKSDPLVALAFKECTNFKVNIQKWYNHSFIDLRNCSLNKKMDVRFNYEKPGKVEIFSSLNFITIK